MLEVVVIDLGNLQGTCTRWHIPCQVLYLTFGILIFFCALFMVQVLVQGFWTLYSKIFPRNDFKVRFDKRPHTLGRVPFTIFNSDKNNNLTECNVKLESLYAIIYKDENDFVELIQPMHKSIYSRALLWQKQASQEGNITVGGGTNEVLYPINVGQEKFCFLYHDDVHQTDCDSSDTSLPEGEYLFQLIFFGWKNKARIIERRSYHASFSLVYNVASIGNPTESNSFPTFAVKEVDRIKIQKALKHRQRRATSMGIPYPKEIITLNKVNFFRSLE